MSKCQYTCDFVLESGPGSVVGIATGYCLDGPGIESRWGRDFSRTCPDRSWGPPSLLYNGYRVFPGGKERPGRDADPSPLLVPWSRKSRAIPLLSLWAVRLVQSLSACTRVHFTLRFYFVLQTKAFEAELKFQLRAWRFLGAFEKLRKVTISFVMRVHPFVCLPLDGFSWTLVH